MLCGMTSLPDSLDGSDYKDCCTGPNLEWLVENCGPSDVAHFLEKFAGTRIYIPTTLNLSEKNDSCAVRLIKSLGWRSAAMIVEGGAGMTWCVPFSRTWRVHHYHAQGLSNDEIARKVGCHRRTVSRALSRSKNDEKRTSMLLEEKS
ncbi:helix-turn-helix domain-containing protein [Brytella acorum]|uniref:helix-turn-helix domain-containing protein n=1 Tax=Brytella acorum TaxID=2959299 RepID=UPI003742F4B8